MNIPKTAAGIGIILFGGASNFIPWIGPLVSPWIIKLGVGCAAAGIAAKAVRTAKEKSTKNLFKNEKIAFNKLTKREET